MTRVRPLERRRAGAEAAAEAGRAEAAEGGLILNLGGIGYNCVCCSRIYNIRNQFYTRLDFFDLFLMRLHLLHLDLCKFRVDFLIFEPADCF